MTVGVAGAVMLLLGTFAWAGVQEPKTSGSASSESTAPKAAATKGIAFPGEPWVLVFDAKDFAVKTDEMESGRPYLLAENQKTNITLSIYLEKPSSGAATEDACEETEKQRLDEKVQYDRQTIAMRKSGGMTVLEYTIPEFDGAPVQQRNLYACLPKGGVFVDIHLSKILFKPQDEKLFSDAIDAIHFVSKTPQNGK